MAACSAPQTERAGHSPDDLKGVVAAERAAQPARPWTDPVAEAAGQPVTWELLQPILAEAAGAQALQELVLDRMLVLELRRRGLSISPEETARERTLVTDTIARDASASPEDTERLLAAVRKRRGLGPARFDRLIERTAGLRKLVATDVTITPEELRQAYDMRHGPRFRARAIMTSTDREAAELLQQLTEGTPQRRPVLFAELATKRSIDPSASRGGILEPISPADPAYPSSIRAALQRLQPGDLSTVIAVDRGFAIVLLEEVTPADGTPFERAAPAIEAQVRLRRERLAMDDLARRLLREADITVIDRSLAWSWQNQPPQQNP
jgi:hypothetical protein